MTCLAGRYHPCLWVGWWPPKQASEKAVSRHQRSHNSILTPNNETKGPEITFSDWPWQHLLGLQFPEAGEASSWIHREAEDTIPGQGWSPDKESGAGPSRWKWPTELMRAWMWIQFLPFSTASGPLVQVIIKSWASEHLALLTRSMRMRFYVSQKPLQSGTAVL